MRSPPPDFNTSWVKAMSGLIAGSDIHETSWARILGAFSSMVAFSYQIVDSWLGAQFGFTPDRKPGRYEPSHLRVGVFNIAEKHATRGRSLDTGRHLAELKPR